MLAEHKPDPPNCGQIGRSRLAVRARGDSCDRVLLLAQAQKSSPLPSEYLIGQLRLCEFHKQVRLARRYGMPGPGPGCWGGNGNNRPRAPRHVLVEVRVSQLSIASAPNRYSGPRDLLPVWRIGLVLCWHSVLGPPPPPGTGPTAFRVS